MSYTIPLENLNIHVNHFNALKKAGLEFEVHQTSEYKLPVDSGLPGYYAVRLHPHFNNVKDIFGVAKIWQATRCPFKVNSIENFTGYEKLYVAENAEYVTDEHYKHSAGTVKFFAKTVLTDLEGLSITLLTKSPKELVKDGHTYRLAVTKGDFHGASFIYFAHEEDPAYNYIDSGRIVISKSSGDTPESRLFVTDSLTLDMNYIIAAFHVCPAALDGVLQNKVFLPSKDCRITLLKIEKNLPAKVQPVYQKLCAQIQEDFSKNTCGVMIGKLTRKESPFVDLNGIRITTKRAVYTAGNVSIEADNLAEVVFKKLNPNEEWDIFTLINIYTDWVEQQFQSLDLNAKGTGFLEEKSFNLKINDIPIKVSVSTENTRRSVNGHLINVDELSPVIKRASCYLVDPERDNKEDFKRFVSNVSRHSLRIRDIWANGLPVKTVYLASDEGYVSSDATSKHPKLRFIYKEKKGFYLQINRYDAQDKKKKTVLETTEHRIGKFAEFVKKVEQTNRKYHMGYSGQYIRTHEGGYELRNGELNSCSKALCELLSIYAEGITEDGKKHLIGSVNFELSEAEKRSEEMLRDACTMTGATPGERAGKKGYIIPGKLRTYFVEEDSLRVYDQNPKAGENAYFCVVNKGEQGVGRDALVARLFALHNDQFMVKQITTLKR